MPKINKRELFSKVFVNVLFISTFIAIFFFTYASYIEKKIVVNQMDFLADDITRTIKLFGQEANDSVLNKLNKVELTNLSRQDDLAQENNNIVKKNAFIYVFILAIVLSIIVIYIYYTDKKNSYILSNILSENFIILIAVAFTEFSFLTFFASHYISINPNNAKVAVLKNLKKDNDLQINL